MEGNQAAARPRNTAEANNAGLNEFLADEGHEHYVDYMLENAEAATELEPQTAHGNGYWVKISAEQVTIQCQHTDEWAPVQVSREHFLSALRAWKAAGCPRTSIVQS